MEDLAGIIIEKKYQLIETVGKGGMGAVYLSKDLKLNTYWAIKVIKKNKDGGNLLAEPNMLKMLQHPMLPRITDISESDKYFFIVMDFVDGRTLESIAKETGAIKEAVVIEWAKQICNALDYLHNLKPNPIIYRDMKPENVMLTKEGSIKVIDFGIAREFKVDASEDTDYLGTRGYAAPEQYRISNSQTDARTDIYGLGVTMYRLLTDKTPDEPPYEIKPVREINKKLSEGIEHIVIKSTALDPSLRYKNIREMLYDLDNVKNIGIEFERKNNIRRAKTLMTIAVMILSINTISSGLGNYRNELNEKYDDYMEAGSEEKIKMDFIASIEEFKEAQKYKPGDEASSYEIVKAYICNWEIEKGIIYLNNLIDTDKKFEDDEYFNYLFGKLSFLNEEYEKAVEYFNKVDNKKRVDDDFSALNRLSNELNQPLKPNSSKIIVDAITEFERFIKENEVDKLLAINLYSAIANIYSSSEVSKIVEDSISKKIVILEKADDLLNGDYIIAEKLAIAYKEQAEKIKKEGKHGVIDILGNESKSKYEKSLEKSLEKYKKCIEIHPKVDIYMNIGDIYLELGIYNGEIKNNKGVSESYKEAIESYEKVISLEGESYLANLRIVNIYYRQGRIDKAKENLEKAEQCVGFDKNNTEYKRLKKSLR
ncbi:serine/threonine-protein kinase [uncultured Clostridium sp.]|jgi:serine/threonine-protein kinase|uniref:serine/threonine-protein kinase n=1 Tax=uncultured Clostridium sp. TaxID=59620 RepID=UPI00263072BA|nr:serine/threonine-protein kinase [uncultured Clostridium sp.]